MNDKDTGGPAFPTLADNGHLMTQDGMTLRDYFAAKAMQAIIGETADWKYSPHDTSKFAYAQADAMMKARNA